MSASKRGAAKRSTTKDVKNLGSRSKSKKKTAKKSISRRKSAAPPGWVWLLTGLSIGLLVAGAVYLLSRSSPAPVSRETVKDVQPPAPVKERSRPAEKKSSSAGEEKPLPEQRFDFYNLLPELEVIIPDSEIKAEQERIKSKTNTRYLIQVGSFRRFAEADGLKAKLALLGIESQIQKVNAGGEEWLRVRVGPFEGTRELNKARNRLHANQINTLVIKLKE